MKNFTQMIQFPPRKGKLERFTDRKAPFFFKNIKLTLDGFKFENFQEFKIHDSIRNSNTLLHRVPRLFEMNDLFIVYATFSKDILVVIFRKNIEFVRNFYDIPEDMDTPSFLAQKMFPESSDFKFYKFIKLIESKNVKFLFKNAISKILLNGDQIIVMQANVILIFSPFGVSTIEVSAIDIAIDRYLYILTENQIQIYDEGLIKTIDLAIKCNFIIPTTNNIFLIKRGTVYRINGENAEIYYECNAHVESCCFDRNHLFAATSRGIVKIGLFKKEVYSMYIKYLGTPKISINDDLVALYSPGSGCIFIKKNDFSIVNLRNLECGFSNIFLFKNCIVYSLDTEERIFEYKIVGNDLFPVEISQRSHGLAYATEFLNFAADPFKLSSAQEQPELNEHDDQNESNKNQSSEDFIGHSLDNNLDSTEEDYVDITRVSQDENSFSKNHRNVFDNLNSSCESPIKKFKSSNHELIKSNNKEQPIFYFKPHTINRLSDFLNTKNSFNIQNPHFNYGSSFYNEKFSLFKRILKFNNRIKIELSKELFSLFNASEKPIKDDYSELVNDVTDNPTHMLTNSSLIPSNLNHSLLQAYITPDKSSQVNQPSSSHIAFQKITEFMPSPQMTQSDSFPCKSEMEFIPIECQPENNLTEDPKFGELERTNRSFMSESLTTRHVNSIVESRFSKIRKFIQKKNLRIVEDSESSSEDCMLFNNTEKQTNPLIEFLSQPYVYPIKAIEQNEISAYKFFKKIDEEFGIHNPITYDNKIDCIAHSHFSSLVFAKNYENYPKSAIFTPNFYDFYEKYFTPRNEKEIDYNYQIYEFINEEFKKVIGYKQNTSNIPTKPKIEVKKKKSGF